MAANIPRCSSSVPIPPALRARHQGTTRLVLVLVTPPPQRNASYEVRPVLQLIQSLQANAPALLASPAILFATDKDEEVTLRRASHVSVSVLVSSFERALDNLSPNSTIRVQRMPESIRCLAPRPEWASIGDLVRYNSNWRTLKRAYGAATAIVDQRASHVLVTDSGFAWKPLHPSDVLQQASTIWFADHRGRSPSFDIRRPPAVDTMARARAFCSLQPWVSTLELGAWQEHAARMAIGRDWRAWEEVVAAAELLPSPDADLSDDPLLVLEAGAFAELWNRVEAHWRAPFADAVVLSLTTPAALYKHCVRGDVLFLELLYRSYLFKFRRAHADGAHADGAHADVAHADGAHTNGGRDNGAHDDGQPRVHFRNATALLERAWPLAARPLGVAFRPAVLPSAADGRWFHAAPSGLARAWLHLDGTRASREALSALHLGALVMQHAAKHAPQHPAQHVARLSPLVAARVDLAEANSCSAIELLLSLPPPAASLSLGSHAPSKLWQQCPALAHGAQIGQSGAKPPVGPFLDGEVAAQKYQAHQAEWGPVY